MTIMQLIAIKYFNRLRALIFFIENNTIMRKKSLMLSKAEFI